MPPWSTSLALFLLAGSASALAPAAAPTALLTSIADWILTTDLRTNNVTHTSDTLKTSIFINGNLARVLLAAHKISPHRADYLDEGLAWCDTLVDLQHRQDTHDGRKNAAGWWDTGYSDLYIADTGTAVTCLALCYDLAGGSRRKAYMEAMLRFADFVANGTSTTPVCDFTPGCAYDAAGNESETCDGWIIGDDDADSDAVGALGDGYYMHRINTKPYTISTATTGGAFFAELSALSSDRGAATEFAGIARAAAAWLLRNVQPNGTIPYFIDPPTNIEHTYQCTSYSTEAILDVDLRGLGGGLDKNEMAAAGRMVDYLLSQQQPSGELIGNEASFGEQQRSPRAASLLQWWHAKTGDARAAAAVQKYVGFLNGELAKGNKSAYGLNKFALVTGFVGLAVADLIEPWCTFSEGMQSDRPLTSF
eukprot:g3928.t1